MYIVALSSYCTDMHGKDGSKEDFYAYFGKI